MNIIIFLILGALIGWAANAIHPSPNRRGIFGDLLLGVAGMFIGSKVAGLLNITVSGLIPQIIAGIIGALIFLVIWGFIKSRLFKDNRVPSQESNDNTEV